MSHMKKGSRLPAPVYLWPRPSVCPRPPSFSPQGTLAQVSRVQGFCLRLQGDPQTRAPLKELTDREASRMEPRDQKV